MSRGFTMPMNIGAIVQDANMLIPYAGKSSEQVDVYYHNYDPAKFT